MGATESKIDPQFLSRFVLDSTRFENDKYWKQLFRSPVTRELLQKHLSLELLRKARQARNPNLVDFFYKVLDALQEVIDCGHKGNLGGVGCAVARNCLCLLTHILPVFLEIPLPHEIRYLQNSDRSQKLLSDSSFVYTLFWLTPHQTSARVNTAFSNNSQNRQLDNVENSPNPIIGNKNERGDSIDKLKVEAKKTNNLQYKAVGELDKRTHKEDLDNYSRTTQNREERISLNVTNTKACEKESRSNLEEGADILKQLTDRIEKIEPTVHQKICYMEKTTDDGNQRDPFVDKTIENMQEATCGVNKIGESLKRRCCCAEKTGEPSKQCCCYTQKAGDVSKQPCCCAERTEDALKQPCSCAEKTEDALKQPCCCTQKTGDVSKQPCCCAEKTENGLKHPCCCAEKTEDGLKQTCCCAKKTENASQQPCCCAEKTEDGLKQPCCCAENKEDALKQPCCCVKKTEDASKQRCCCVKETEDASKQPCCCAEKTEDASKQPYCLAEEIEDGLKQPCCCTEETEDASEQPSCYAPKLENALQSSGIEVEKPHNDVKETMELLDKMSTKEEQVQNAVKQLDNNGENLLVRDVHRVINESVNEPNKGFEQLTLTDNTPFALTEDEQMKPLAIKILSTLQQLLFLKNFTLLIPHVVFPERYIPPRQKVNTQLLWNGVVGGNKSSSYCKLSNDIYSNRKAVLTCLLVCLSSQVYRTQLMRIKSPPCLWLWVFTQGSMPYIGNLYCSLMSVVFSKTSSSLLGFDFVSSKTSFSYENDLRGIAAKLFCVLINFDIPSKCDIPPETEKLLLSNRDTHQDEISCVSNLNHESSKPKFFNIYRLMLAAMKNEKEIIAVYDEICLQIKASCGTFHSKFSSPLALKNSCTEEHLLILWNLLISNKSFLQHATQKTSIQKLLVPLLCTMLEASGFLHESIRSEKKHNMETSIVTGVLHLCSLILFVLSAERQFATQANEPFNESFPISFTFFRGSYADLIILSFYQICTSELMSIENESLIDIFLTTLCNMSPYLRSLCPESSMKLVSLFQRLSRPHWLFEQPYRYRNAFLLLEIFDNIIQYQYTGNYNLIYSILRQKNVFEAFHLLEFSKSQKNVPQSSLTPDEHKEETRESINTTEGSRLKASKTLNDSWCATEEWFNTWKAEAPTQTVMCVIDKLIPLVNEMCADDEFPEQSDIIEMIKNTMLVGILPVPPSILIRNYVPHITTNQWFVTFTWKIIALKLRNEFHLPNLLLFNMEMNEETRT